MVALWSHHLNKYHKGTASALCSPKATDNIEFSGALLPFFAVTRDSHCDTQMGHTHPDTAPDPWGDASASLLRGLGVAKCPVGVFPSWERKAMGSSLQGLCRAGKAPVGSWRTAGPPGTRCRSCSLARNQLALQSHAPCL